jgi:hypothetical protein
MFLYRKGVGWNQQKVWKFESISGPRPADGCENYWPALNQKINTVSKITDP